MELDHYLINVPCPLHSSSSSLCGVSPILARQSYRDELLAQLRDCGFRVQVVVGNNGQGGFVHYTIKASGGGGMKKGKQHSNNNNNNLVVVGEEDPCPLEGIDEHHRNHSPWTSPLPHEDGTGPQEHTNTNNPMPDIGESCPDIRMLHSANASPPPNGGGGIIPSDRVSCTTPELLMVEGGGDEAANKNGHHVPPPQQTTTAAGLVPPFSKYPTIQIPLSNSSPSMSTPSCKSSSHNNLHHHPHNNSSAVGDVWVFFGEAATNFKNPTTALNTEFMCDLFFPDLEGQQQQCSDTEHTENNNSACRNTTTTSSGTCDPLLTHQPTRYFHCAVRCSWPIGYAVVASRWCASIPQNLQQLRDEAYLVNDTNVPPAGVTVPQHGGDEVGPEKDLTHHTTTMGNNPTLPIPPHVPHDDLDDDQSSHRSVPPPSHQQPPLHESLHALLLGALPGYPKWFQDTLARKLLLFSTEGRK